MLALGTVLGAAACGGDDQKNTKPAKVTNSITYPQAPTAADLNSKLRMVVDPSVPNEQKLDLVQGVSADPNLPQRLVDFYRQNNATITVTGVTDLGNGALTAETQATANGGQPQQTVVPFVVEGGQWKVQKEWICSMLTLSNQTSPACG